MNLVTRYAALIGCTYQENVDKLTPPLVETWVSGGRKKIAVESQQNHPKQELREHDYEKKGKNKS